MPTPSPIGRPLRRSGHARTRARSPPRSAPPPLPARADRAGPSARHAGSQGPPAPGRNAAAVRRASLSLPASRTAFVISSTNRGMPSARSTMSWRMLAGSGLPPAIWSTIASNFARASRSRATAVTCGCPLQGGSNSGRNVTIRSARSAATRLTARPSTSRLVGSPQCTSSKIISTGLARASVSICADERL